MKRIDAPNFDTRSCLDACTKGMTDRINAAELQEMTQELANAEALYQIRAKNAELYSIQTISTVHNKEKMQKIRDLYDKTFTRNKDARHIYSSIKKSSPNDVCPFCNHRSIFTLDHFLPKSSFPEFSISPINLIPACYECNIWKSSYIADLPGEQLFHPYFDNFVNTRWLFASIIKTAPTAASFYADPPRHWSEIERNRTKFHFKRLKLSSLYSSQSAVEIANIRHYLKKILSTRGHSGVHSYLKEIYESKESADSNSWQAAFYDAAARSEWFCEGGFLET